MNKELFIGILLLLKKLIGNGVKISYDIESQEIIADIYKGLKGVQSKDISYLTIIHHIIDNIRLHLMRQGAQCKSLNLLCENIKSKVEIDNNINITHAVTWTNLHFYYCVGLESMSDEVYNSIPIHYEELVNKKQKIMTEGGEKIEINKADIPKGSWFNFQMQQAMKEYKKGESFYLEGFSSNILTPRVNELNFKYIKYTFTKEIKGKLNNKSIKRDAVIAYAYDGLYIHFGFAFLNPIDKDRIENDKDFILGKEIAKGKALKNKTNVRVLFYVPSEYKHRIKYMIKEIGISIGYAKFYDIIDRINK